MGALGFVVVADSSGYDRSGREVTSLSTHPKAPISQQGLERWGLVIHWPLPLESVAAVGLGVFAGRLQWLCGCADRETIGRWLVGFPDAGLSFHPPVARRLVLAAAGGLVWPVGAAAPVAPWIRSVDR